jgi:serine/threonine protein kinase
MKASTAPSLQPGALFAERYEVESMLARGGMGEVYRVRDQSSGTLVALKRLIETNSKAAVGKMFEREYHTLTSLAHPRIIEVYAYGLGGGVPYYTMELLDGKDLRELAPLPYREACRHLRDVASSLALLHARRLLHRDLSPRNVRITSDERAKLIDFGALTGFGLSESVVGTPPFVPPEALHHAPLDQRADLYSLGALAYWLLTGRNAFPVHQLADLPEAWRRTPARPSEVVQAVDQDLTALPPIPRALDELVMALLTPNPLGRPATAAEVIDRFTAIGGIEPDHEPLSSQSYLRSPALVGRDRELERLDSRLHDALSGRGACVVIEGAAGMGSSRMLAELSLRAQLAGAVPILIDASLNRGPYGVVHDMIGKLLQSASTDAEAAVRPHGAALARFSPTVAARFSIAPDQTNLAGMPGELRRATQHALAQWLGAFSARRPLVLAIDNLQDADEGSVALLSTLARGANARPMLVVVAHDAREISRHAAAIKTLQAIGTNMRLRPLGNEHVGILTRSLFGDVQNAARLSEWLRGLSGGSPRACMDLVQHLVDRDVLRYVDGMWVLPQELRPEELPASLDQVLGTRLARMPDAARRLAEALSVHHGMLSLSRCLAIAEAEGVSEAFSGIEDLVREAVLVQAGEHYHFCHDSMRETLLARIAPERLKRLHAQLGALLSAQLDGDLHATLDAGWHLLHGGREAEGAELLAKAGIALGYDGDELSAAVPPLIAALKVFRAQGRSDHALIQLLGPLTMGGYYSDRRLATEFGDETIRLLKKVLGLTLAARLRPFIGHRLGVYVGLGYAAVGFILHPERGGIAGLRKTITVFINCILCLVGESTICFRRDRAKRFARELEILSALGEDHAATWTFRMTSLLATIPEDRQAQTIAGLEEVLERFDDPRPIRDMPVDARRMMHGGIMYALGALEAFRAGHKALHYADRLERLGIRLYAMVADQVRTNHHALRGETVVASQYRARVEMHAVQSGSGWQAEIWAPSSLILSQGLCRDRLGLKHTMETLDRLCAEVPSLERHAKMARATYYTLKGDHRRALALRRTVLDPGAPRDVVGWANAVAAQGQSLRLLGEPAQARALLQDSIALLDAADRDIVVMTHNLFVELALSTADLGDLPMAARILDDHLAAHGKCDGPLVLGNLHCARAQIALRAGELVVAEHHVEEMESWFQPTGNPTLIALCAQLRRELSRSENMRNSLSVPPPSFGARWQDEHESVRSVLSVCGGPRERAEKALQMLLDFTGGQAGYLFWRSASGLQLLAPTHGDEPGPELQAQVLARLSSGLREETFGSTHDADVTRIESATAHPRDAALGEPAYRLLVLSTDLYSIESVVGAAAIACGARQLRVPTPRMLQSIAEALHEDAA